MKISIIIPTLNEEDYLQKLLVSIKKQDFKDYEIIVADAGSKDGTKKIAKKHDCTIVQGGLPGVGRNNGAKIAKGEYLLFLDADIILPHDYLSKTIKYAEKHDISYGTSPVKPISKKLRDKILHGIFNLAIKISSLFKGSTPGYCILVKKTIFTKSKGFKNMTFEDIDLLKRLKGKFGVLPIPIFVSVRRLEKEGRMRLSARLIKANLYNIIGKDINKITHEFDIYKKN